MPDDEKPANGQKPQKLKKSETLEVRIPYETKQAFLTACREDGTTASEVVRENIQSYLDERVRPIPQPERSPDMSNVVAFVKNLHPTVRRYGPRVAASGIAALALATFATLPSAAAPDFQSQFKKYDLNGDGVVTLEEFTGKTGGAGKTDDMTFETRIIRSSKDGKVVIEKSDKPADLKPMEMKQEAFSFWLPEELTGGADNPHNTEYRFATSSRINIDTDGPGKDGAGANIDMAPLIISREGMQKREFDGFDADKDGKVSFTEFQARQKAMLTRGFEMLDADNDKVLSPEEYSKIGSPPMPKIAMDKIGGLDKDNMRHIQIVSGGPKYSDEQLKAAFTKLDSNKDKKLSLQEYLPPT